MQLKSEKCPAGFLQGVGLFLARFCPSAWFGAAILFVIVGVTEVTRGGFDAATKDQLVALRFPAFYACGAALISAGSLGTMLVGITKAMPISRWLIALILLLVVAGLMIADYSLIYQPLFQMVMPPGQAKSAGFVSLHQASKMINLVELIICLVVVVLMNWPVRQSSQSDS